MKYSIILLSACFFPLVALGAVGFETGNDFLATTIRGQLTVNCHDGMRNSLATYSCTDEVLDPADYERFQGPAGLDANKIVLRALREDGSSQEKSEGYDPKTGLSTGHFNLWISTLLQRPLFKEGKNAIHYSFRKGSKPVLEGDLVANVNPGPDRVCHHRGYYYSGDLNDCVWGQQICARYFRDENYCQ
jgi:hypothetical protein